MDIESWFNTRPAQYLYWDFEGLDLSYYKVSRSIRCLLKGVTPGKYWVEAVWDRKKPFYNWDDDFYKPERGDYESVESPVIEVKAGEKLDAGKIKCEKKVKGT